MTQDEKIAMLKVMIGDADTLETVPDEDSREWITIDYTAGFEDYKGVVEYCIIEGSPQVANIQKYSNQAAVYVIYPIAVEWVKINDNYCTSDGTTNFVQGAGVYVFIDSLTTHINTIEVKDAEDNIHTLLLKDNNIAEDTTTSSDDVLSVYLDLAAQKVISRAYPYDIEVTEVPAQYETVQLEIAAYMLNKRGAEGETAHSENGISRTYENADVPESMLNGITPHCGVPQ